MSSKPFPTWAAVLLLIVGGFCWYQLIQLYGQPKHTPWPVPENKPVWDQVAEIQLDEERYGKLPDPKTLDPRATGWSEGLTRMPESEARARIQTYHRNLRQLHQSRRKVITEMRQRGEEPTVTDPLDLMSPKEYKAFLKQAERDLVTELQPLWLSVDGGSPFDGGLGSDTGPPSTANGLDAAQPSEPKNALVPAKDTGPPSESSAK